ncbi:MAG TPA: DUF3152 domain-containing protein [Nocardioides sp.]|nr:DUF3152 domain-containing protein [Nocardioides sp.]
MRRLIVVLLVGLLWPAPAGAAGSPPVSTSPPVVHGKPVVGHTLEVKPGAWEPTDATLTHRWTRDGDPVSGATGTTYTLVAQDVGHLIAVTETATASDGATTSVDSDPVGPVRKPTLHLDTEPAITGVMRYQRTVTADLGDTRPNAGSVSFHWLRDGERVTGPRGHYRLGYRDVGHRMRLVVAYHRDGYRTLHVRSAARTVLHRVAVRRTFSYSVRTKGDVTADVAVFRKQAQQTYDDPRGWRAAGFAFHRVRRGGDFTLVLATAAMVPTYSSACSSTWSCRVGRFVIINQTRWLHASPAWNRAHLPRRGYRHLVVDHETGHWLGHPHAQCSGSGPAPVMMQQSKGTGACSFNPWPLPAERWTSR